jgi:cardiolipin synthase
LASWLGNLELDAIVENDAFGRSMEEMYLQDLDNATEVVLDQRRRLHASKEQRASYTGSGNKGSVNRAAAGAARIGHTIGAALTDRRVLGPIEARLATISGLLLCVLSLFFALFPRVLAYPLVGLGTWGGLVLLYRGYRLMRKRK